VTAGPNKFPITRRKY